ncbi:C45 family autoproteolytic acyltransferase/hydolase [Halegenticoccus tardaugens]|uniref:C45 family autoproteolytic acyltransferase/hydolase n=1 Tax=Halegenticoccus tardaugens TaxID=2071624 RepID=UPI00100B7404|nr:C45 family peptidase [Halegenticoccus tardaugens]
MSELPHIALSGTAYERGVVHGETFADEIRKNVSVYLDRFEHHGASEETVRERAADFLPRIEEWHPEYAEELRGVAEGSGVPDVLVALLNVRYEVLYAAYSDESAGIDGCTSFGLLPEATADGHAYVGQNWDWAAPIADTLIVTEVRRDDGPDHLAVTEAGIVGGKMGVNERGIGLAVNGLVSPNDGDRPFRKPFHIRCREVLNAGRFDAALEALVSSSRVCSANFVVGHADGEVINVETSPDRTGYVYPSNGIVAHANHFVTDGFESRMERQLPDTLYRASRLRRPFERRSGDVDLGTVESALRDHFGHPASICRHVDDGAHPLDATQTDTSVIVDLTDRTIRATRGPPCEAAYATYRLERTA